MTKSLKLLYIIDETSIKEIGSPITWLDYKVWGDGPVAIDIYNEIKRNEKICYRGKELSLDKYIVIERKLKSSGEEIYLKPQGTFDFNLFNRYESNLLENVVSKFGNWSAKELITYLHNENSLWHKAVMLHNLDKHFIEINKITNYSIEFTELIEDDPILLMANKASLEALQFKQRLSDYAE